MHSFFIHHYIVISPYIIGIILLLSIVLCVYIWFKIHDTPPKMKLLSVVILVTYYSFVLLSTVFSRTDFQGSSVELEPYMYNIIVNNDYSNIVFEEILINIIMFIPIGVLLGLIKRMNIIRLCLLSICLSGFIELLQFICQKGICEINDLIHNTIGCVIGYGIMSVFIKRFHF